MSGSGDRRGGGPPGSGEHLPPLPLLLPVVRGWTDRAMPDRLGGRVGFRVDLRGILFRGSVPSRACGLVASVAPFWAGCFGATGVLGDDGRGANAGSRGCGIGGGLFGRSSGSSALCSDPWCCL
jgi:hypothetical protein